jgi:hypothetical protein
MDMSDFDQANGRASTALRMSQIGRHRYLQIDALALAQEAAQDLLPGVLNVLGHLALGEEDLDQAECYYRQCLSSTRRCLYGLGESGAATLAPRRSVQGA